MWEEEADRRRWSRLRVSPDLLETRWNWAVDALEMIRKEDSGAQGRRGPGGQTLNLSIPAAPFFSRQRV